MAQLTARAFLNQKEAVSRNPLLLLLGSDLYWRTAVCNHILQTMVPDRQAPGAVVRTSLREEDLSNLLAQAQTKPLFVPCQVLLIEAAEILEAESTGHVNPVASLADYLRDPTPSTILAFEAADLDKRGKLYRLFRDNALVVELDFELEIDSATVSGMAQSLGYRLNPEAAQTLLELCGNSRARVHAELEKLITYLGVRPEIKTTDVRNLVFSSATRSVWELADALMEGHTPEALQRMDGLLRAGENASKLVGALAWTYRKLIQAKELPRNTTSWQAAQILGVRPQSAQQFLRRSHATESQLLLGALAALAEADLRLKSAGTDDRTILEFLVIRLASITRASHKIAPNK
jgi:DNA polymerase III subunit delta